MRENFLPISAARRTPRANHSPYSYVQTNRQPQALTRCFVFIDEADQALGKRDSGSNDSGLSGRIYSMMATETSRPENYRLVKVQGETPLEAVQQCLDGYQNPVAAEVMDFQMKLAVKGASDLEFVPEIFRAKR